MHFLIYGKHFSPSTKPKTQTISDYKLYQEKAKAQLDEWEAEQDKMRDQAEPRRSRML